MVEYLEGLQALTNTVKVNDDTQQVNSSEKHGGIHESRLSILTKGVHMLTREEF